jgi:hypothetical protein
VYCVDIDRGDMVKEIICAMSSKCAAYACAMDITPMHIQPVFEEYFAGSKSPGEFEMYDPTYQIAHVMAILGRSIYEACAMFDTGVFTDDTICVGDIAGLHGSMLTKLFAESNMSYDVTSVCNEVWHVLSYNPDKVVNYFADDCSGCVFFVHTDLGSANSKQSRVSTRPFRRAIECGSIYCDPPIIVWEADDSTASTVVVRDSMIGGLEKIKYRLSGDVLIITPHAEVTSMKRTNITNVIPLHGSYDTIVVYDQLMLWRNPSDCLSKCIAMLRPNGRLIICVADDTDDLSVGHVELSVVVDLWKHGFPRSFANMFVGVPAAKAILTGLSSANLWHWEKLPSGHVPRRRVYTYDSRVRVVNRGAWERHSTIMSTKFIPAQIVRMCDYKVNIHDIRRILAKEREDFFDVLFEWVNQRCRDKHK